MAEPQLSEASANQSLIKADAQSISRAFAVATTPEAAQYFEERLEAVIKNTRGAANQYKDVLAEVKNYTEIINLQRASDTESLWRGDKDTAVLTKYRTYQENRANMAVKELVKVLDEGQMINFAFAMNNSAELLQGFSVGGQSPSQEMSENMNLIFSDWLTRNHMVCEEGVIYQADDTGTVTQNAAGQKMIVDSNDYIERFASKGEEGFEVFCAEKSQKITGNKLVINVSNQEYPKPTPAEPSASA